MGYLVPWISYLPIILAVCAIVYVPGFAVGRALGASRYLAIIIAPALTFAIVGVSGLVLGRLDIAWGWPTFLIALAIAVAIAGAVGRLHAMEAINSLWRNERAMTVRQHWAHIAICAIAALFLIVPILALAAPAIPSSQADPMFHYNGVNVIVMSGNASPTEAMGANHGVRVMPSTYPIVWHTLLALLGNGHIMPATHAFAYVVVPLIWLASLDFFVRAALPRHPRAWVVAPAIAVILPYMPNFLSVSRGFWPNAIAIAVIPVTYGLGALMRRSLPVSRKREILVPIALILGVILGMGLAHPGAVFATLWPLVPLATVLVVVGTIRGVREKSRPWLIAGGGSALAMITGSVLLLHPRVLTFLERTHPRSWDTAERIATLRIELADVSTALIVGVAVLGLVAIVGVALAIRVAWRIPEARWIVIAWFAQWLIVFGSYVDGNIFSTIAGIWYHDPKRAMAIQMIFTTVIVALLVDRWIGAKERHAPVIAVGTVVASLVLGVVMRVGSVYQDARPPLGADRIVDSREEIELLSELDELLPPGSLIIGDATTGLGYAPAYSRVDVVFPQVNSRTSDVDGEFLRESFRDIHDDPYVCRVLSEYGIRYYYEDDPIVYQKRNRSDTWPGLYDVDTSRGFTKIAESDGGTLWRIDACGPIGEPHWWDLEERFMPVPRPRSDTLPNDDPRRIDARSAHLGASSTATN